MAEPIATPTRRKRKLSFTAEELLRLPTDGRRMELVKGKVYELPPAGARHGSVAMNIGMLLGAHVRLNGLGRVFAAETGFTVERHPDTMRAPDAAFVSNLRLPQGELPDGFLELAPDLAVEVVSPSDSRREIQEKAEGWLLAGTHLVWVINPVTRAAMIYRSRGDVQHATEEDYLHGEDVVPGFSCRLGVLFD